MIFDILIVKDFPWSLVITTIIHFNY